jgi:hypothetical protein
MSAKNDLFEKKSSKKICLYTFHRATTKSKKSNFFKILQNFHILTVLVNQKTERLLFNAQNPEKPITSQLRPFCKFFTFLKLQNLETCGLHASKLYFLKRKYVKYCTSEVCKV